MLEHGTHLQVQLVRRPELSLGWKGGAGSALFELFQLLVLCLVVFVMSRRFCELVVF